MERQPMEALEGTERERHEALLKRLDHFARTMDSSFRLPGTRIRFGLDGLLGLVPVLGDATTALAGLYMLWEALKIGAPRAVTGRIARNVVLDFLLGLVPIAGDALDFVFKANERNAALLRDYAQSRLQPPEPAGKVSRPLIWLLTAMGALLLTLVVIAI